MPDKPVEYRVLTHDRLAEQYEHITTPYDLHRRLEVLIDAFLATETLKDKLVLDAGCGTGRGTERFNLYGAQVIALDLAPNMLNYTRQRYACTPLLGDVAALPFPPATFDVIFSTEVIEHTPDPLACARELYRAVKPGGHLVLSTPGWLWQWPIRLASALRVRAFDGLENFVRPAALRRTLEQQGGQVLDHRGIHLLPFQITALHPFLRYMDRYGDKLLPLTINQCIHCVKPA
jgi:2-polyprenyl-3-methyl-5-hydroxy-6-metoxy-1,4-benzoquinol methylase